MGGDFVSFARDIERAVLAKAMPIPIPNQEPIGKIFKSAECGGFDFYFDKIPDGETMLYAGPTQIPNQDPIYMWKIDDEEEGWIECSKDWFDDIKFTHATRIVYAEPQPAQEAAIPDGYCLVPEEPTASMIDAGVAMALRVSVHGEGGWSKYLRGLYKQMLSASPKQE